MEIEKGILGLLLNDQKKIQVFSTANTVITAVKHGSEASAIRKVDVYLLDDI